MEGARIRRVEKVGGVRRSTLVRSGNVGLHSSFKDSLQVVSTQNVELGILHIRGSLLEGDVAIASASTILGASTNSGLSGWSAVRALLTLAHASYQFHDFSRSDIGSLDQGLSIKLSKVIDAMPQLPEIVEGLSGRGTLNRIRAVDIQAAIEERQNEKALSKQVKREIIHFEQKSMKWRAVFFWGLCLLIAIVTCFVHPHIS